MLYLVTITVLDICTYVHNMSRKEILTQVAKQLLGHPPVPILPILEKGKDYTILMFFMSVPTLLDAE